ncbi:MAG: OmpA family protein [Saprospiraceae bacterium]
MMRFLPFPKTVLAFFPIFLFQLSIATAQKSDLVVIRCGAVSKTSAVKNLWVSADNSKWVANGQGVFRVRACDLATPMPLEAGMQTAYQFDGGNSEVLWTTENLKAAAKTDFTPTAAWYDGKNDALWLGSKDAGVFRFKTKPALQLVENLTVANSKLKSNDITHIFQDKSGRMWIGHENGALVGTAGKWKTELDGFSVQRVREAGGDIWVLADGEFWQVIGGEKFKALDIDSEALEGEPADFDIAPDGRLWILSHILARYDLLAGTFETFSGPEDFTSLYGTHIAADSDGAIWVGTSDKGLYLVEKSSSLTVNILIDKELSCNGPGNDAALSVKVSGGSAPFNFKWSAPNLTGDALTGLSAGTYTVTVSDKTGKSKTSKITIESGEMRLSVKQKKETTAPDAANGAAEVEVEGGTGPFAFLWDNNEKTAQAVRLSEGKHSVTVTDRKGCSSTASVDISQKINALSVSIREVTGNRCAGMSEAALAVQTTGGKPPFKYAWDNRALSGDQPIGLRAGSYTVTVTDAVGSTASATFEVKQPPNLTALLNVDASASVGQADGKATANGAGGVGKYTFKWDNGEVGAKAVKLAAGKHNITVMDANGCTVITTFDITENILPLRVSLAEKTSIKCAGEAVAALEATVSGGKAPFKFAWSNPAASGQFPEKLPAGAYTLTVSDVDGSQTTASITIKQPDALALSVKVDAPASTGNSDGKATLRASGGAGKFEYKWDNGETTVTATKLAPGKHTATATDANGCTTTVSLEITENILPLRVAIAEKTPIKCAGQKVAALAAEVSGGKPPYKYVWDNPAATGENPANLPSGKYSLTVSDAAGTQATATFDIVQPAALFATAKVDAPASTGNSDGKATIRANGGAGKYDYKWDNGETTVTATKLAPGKHSVTATDANGCTTTATVEISENILPLAVSISEKASIKCAGQNEAALEAEVSGGKPPYKFNWSNPAASGDSPKNLPAGNFSLTITDAVGSTATANLNVKQPENLTITAKVDASASTGNSDGKASARASGGAGKYDYKWDNGETTVTATKLAPGKHTVTATDANGCTATATVEISENILPLAVALSEKASIKCAGQNEAALETEVSGGKSPYKFAWSSAAISGENPANVPAGSYTLTVTDAKGTSQTASITVKQPEPITAEIVKNTGATTDRSNDGRATISAKGGTGALSIAWDNGETGEKATKLALGGHTVVVTDARGCTKTVRFDTPKRILPELNASQLKTGQNVRMEQLQFAADSTNLNESCMPVLNEVYDFLVENGGIVIEIGGHTNSTPPDAYCDRLSSGRAKAVADYLISRGIDPKRVYSKGYGKRQPVASNATPEGRKRNQRVEIKILKIE